MSVQHVEQRCNSAIAHLAAVVAVDYLLKRLCCALSEYRIVSVAELARCEQCYRLWWMTCPVEATRGF